MKKKKAIKKPSPTKAKVYKKTVSQKPKSNQAMVVVSYNDIIKPETFKGELGLLNSYFPDRVIKFILQPVPAKYIFKREGTGGKMFDYVPGWYAKKCANYAFGFNHSFEIKTKEILGMSAVIEGRLVIHDPKTGREILHKDDIGGHQIRFFKGKAHTPENAVDIANDYKSAATDAFKRCMSQIGFFSNVYGMNEAKQDNYPVADAPSESVQQNTSAQPAPSEEIDYKRALDNLLISLGAKTDIEKLRLIAKYTLLKYNDYAGIASGGAKSIFLQIKRKTGE